MDFYMVTDVETKHTGIRLRRGKSELTIIRIPGCSNLLKLLPYHTRAYRTAPYT